MHRPEHIAVHQAPQPTLALSGFTNTLLPFWVALRPLTKI